MVHGHVGSSGPGLEPVSPALAGGFLSTVPPGKPSFRVFNCSTDCTVVRVRKLREEVVRVDSGFPIPNPGL